MRHLYEEQCFIISSKNMKIFTMGFIATCAWLCFISCSDVDEKKQQLCCGSVALSKFHSHNSFCSAWPSESSSKPQQCHLKHSSSESTWQLPLFSVPAVCTPCRVSVGHQLIPRQIYFFNKSEIHSQHNSEGTGLLWSKASSTRET